MKMNMNPSQQNRPTGSMPWAPPSSGQAANFPFQPGQHGGQNMPPGAGYGPPKGSAGQFTSQPSQNTQPTVPMFSQNGTSTPPSSLNPASMGNGPVQNQVNQVVC